MPSSKSFETERLQLAPTVLEDAPFIFELMNSPKWLQFIGDRNINSVEDARTYITTRITPQLQRLGYSNYTVCRKMDMKRIGSCGLYDREGLDGIDLGFAFLPEYEGQGYAFEASERLLQAAFQEFGLNQLSAITAKDNYASQRLLTKLKFEVVKTISLPKDTQELLLYTYN